MSKAGYLLMIGTILSLIIVALAFGDETSQTVHSKNFVVAAPDMATAKQVLQDAEAYRKEIALEWLGQELPKGIGPTVISVRFKDDQFGQTWIADSKERLSHLMWLHGYNKSEALEPLKHEIAHTVLATRYPGQLPVWLHEGIASKYDSTSLVKGRTDTIQWYKQGIGLPSAESIFKNRVRYTQDYTICTAFTDYLLSTYGKDKTILFALEAEKFGHGAAALKELGISFDELDKKWRE